MDTLRRAADSVGISVADLVTMAVDSGVKALPAVSQLTEETTLEDLGQRLWGIAQGQVRSKRASWFSDLAPAQQDALIVVLRARGHSSQTIAQDFGVGLARVTSSYNKHADSLGRPLVNIRMATLAGQLQLMAERSQEMAMKKDDPATFWRIAKDFVGVLQTMGIVDKAAQRIDVDHKVTIGEGQKEAAIDRLISVREKQRMRHEEIKKAEVELLDEQLPEEFDDDDV